MSAETAEKRTASIDYLSSFMPESSPHRHQIMWLTRLGIDDDTTLEEYDRYETLMFGLNKFQLKTLLAVVDVQKAHNLEEFERLVDEVHANKWTLYEELKTKNQLNYFLEHDYRMPDENLTEKQLLGGKEEPSTAEGILDEQDTHGWGGLSCFGWVDYTA